MKRKHVWLRHGGGDARERAHAFEVTAGGPMHFSRCGWVYRKEWAYPVLEVEGLNRCARCSRLVPLSDDDLKPKMDQVALAEETK